MKTLQSPYDISFQLRQYTQFMFENEYTEATCANYNKYLLRFLSWPMLKTKCKLFENINNFLKSEQQTIQKHLNTVGQLCICITRWSRKLHFRQI